MVSTIEKDDLVLYENKVYSVDFVDSNHLILDDWIDYSHVDVSDVSPIIAQFGVYIAYKSENHCRRIGKIDGHAIKDNTYRIKFDRTKFGEGTFFLSKEETYLSDVVRHWLHVCFPEYRGNQNMPTEDMLTAYNLRQAGFYVNYPASDSFSSHDDMLYVSSNSVITVKENLIDYAFLDTPSLISRLHRWGEENE